MAEPRNMDKPRPSNQAGGMNANPERDSSHPVATGVGALGGAAAGAAVGTMVGPVGTVVGAVAGAVVGGLGGHAVGRAFDPVEEDSYWRDNYSNEPYYEAGRSYDDYGPAYALGMHGRNTYAGRFDDVEDRLSQDWERQRGGSSLSWQQAREPSRAAWRRIEENYPSTGQGQPTASTTYSTRGSSGQESDNTLRSSAHRVDVSSGEDISLATLPSSDSSIPGSEAYARQRDRNDRGDAGAAVGSAQSASAGDISDTDDVIDVLNDLVECCRDGEYGFKLCAEHVQNSEIQQKMMRHAEECRSAASELMDRIRGLGGDVDEGGSVMGSVHRGWVSVKGKLAGYSDRAMLEEAERGEDNAVALYRKALRENLPPDIRALIERQAQGVQRNHDEMKLWRDRLRERG